MKFDFSGYATKNDLKCTDGRVIRRDAFKHNDGDIVPLVWQHMLTDPQNVLGHAVLENREDGVYAYGRFNNTEKAQHAKELIKHGDIKALSIFANRLKQRGSDVVHGTIREVSLVLSGANPGATIDNVSFSHADGTYDVSEEEAIIHSGEEIKEVEANVEDEETLQDIIDTMTDKQKSVLYALMATKDGEFEDDEEDEQVDEDLEHSDILDIEEIEEGDEIMHKNIFEQVGEEKHVLKHSEIESVIKNAEDLKMSLSDAFMLHAETQNYGIENIDWLFPEFQNLDKVPELYKRDTEWVSNVLGKVRKTPFTRIRTMQADITADEARAKGYVKGNRKKEEVFGLMRRTTSPTTIYKKQKLDRDDILDITDFDVVAFLKSEMRLMLDEEIARAALIGDGRPYESEDKINEENIRPIYTDDELYSHKVEIAAEKDPAEIIEDIIRSRKHYKGSGNPTFYTTTDMLTEMLLVKDKLGRRLYETEEQLRSALRVSAIVEVPPMEDLTRIDDGVNKKLLGIIVNLSDYSLGADKGGRLGMFDDFDIDFNQHKYLIETRLSGALTKLKSALVIEQVVEDDTVNPGDNE